MEQNNPNDLAYKILMMFKGVSKNDALDTIARIAASTVIGGSCNREQLFVMINNYLTNESN